MYSILYLCIVYIVQGRARVNIFQHVSISATVYIWSMCKYAEFSLLSQQCVATTTFRFSYVKKFSTLLHNFCRVNNIKQFSAQSFGFRAIDALKKAMQEAGFYSKTEFCWGKKLLIWVTSSNWDKLEESKRFTQFSVCKYIQYTVHCTSTYCLIVCITSTM